jgi:hypothetical protein|tara:strand:- start:59 stop:322 length:264 start_codon:yes stop_codon:yes gene_type:complete
MGSLIPGQALLYERSNGVVYARYRDFPHSRKPRWIIGGDPGAVERAQGKILSYNEWQELCELAKDYPTLQKLLDKCVNMYYITKEYK